MIEPTEEIVINERSRVAEARQLQELQELVFYHADHGKFPPLIEQNPTLKRAVINELRKRGLWSSTVTPLR